MAYIKRNVTVSFAAVFCHVTLTKVSWGEGCVTSLKTAVKETKRYKVQPKTCKTTTGVWKTAFNYGYAKFSNFLFSTIFPLFGALSKPIQLHVLSTILHNIHCALNLSRKSSIFSRFFTKIRSFYNQFCHNCYLNTLHPAKHVHCSGKKFN